MKMSKTVLSFCAGLGLLAAGLLPGTAAAQDWPKAPVRIVLPFTPGGGDQVFRIIAPRLQDRWKQPVVIDYKPGASNIVATDYIVKSRPDGYTIGVTGATVANNPLFYKTIPYTYDDFSGITKVVNLEMALVARNDAPFNTVPELVAYAKANPGVLNWGTGGLGATYVGFRQFMYAAGIDMVHVNFPGWSQALSELMGGRLDLVIDPHDSSVQFVKSHRMKMLASFGPKRIAGFEQIPAVNETYPGVDITPYLAFIAPKGTPAAILKKIHQDTVEVLGDPAIRRQLADLGLNAATSTPEETDRAFRTETVEWARIARQIKLPPPQ
ncbi:tripartite tricarboxylate transporter substrate binding protein [Xylophilus rhododendri]|uniref:Tripartite tricarboxylate transporter substrate binding protein n=1 Tax=Xylophilus rhododendri TaxID=2697032 RepID=A0A857JCY2_9BURK|nr:tripartite tricarboxylate transporter substrate binding protein [Xylophilus rhododendri]QHJ00960.1 tripartite tricarboxylate transporter substrate binding protein [Xylophilus rhododendri]